MGGVGKARRRVTCAININKVLIEVQNLVDCYSVNFYSLSSLKFEVKLFSNQNLDNLNLRKKSQNKINSRESS